jgi:hypothetical protein
MDPFQNLKFVTSLINSAKCPVTLVVNCLKDKKPVTLTIPATKDSMAMRVVLLVLLFALMFEHEILFLKSVNHQYFL